MRTRLAHSSARGQLTRERCVRVRAAPNGLVDRQLFGARAVRDFCLERHCFEVENPQQTFVTARDKGLAIFAEVDTFDNVLVCELVDFLRRTTEEQKLGY